MLNIHAAIEMRIIIIQNFSGEIFFASSHACLFFLCVPQHSYCHYWGVGSHSDGGDGVVAIIIAVIVVVVESRERIFSV